MSAIASYVDRQFSTMNINRNKIHPAGYEGGGGVAGFAHALLKNAREQESYRNERAHMLTPRFEDCDGEVWEWSQSAVRAKLDYLRGGCQCAVCIEYGGDCPTQFAMADAFDVWTKRLKRMERAAAREGV